MASASASMDSMSRLLVGSSWIRQQTSMVTNSLHKGHTYSHRQESNPIPPFASLKATWSQAGKGTLPGSEHPVPWERCQQTPLEPSAHLRESKNKTVKQHHHQFQITTYLHTCIMHVLEWSQKIHLGTQWHKIFLGKPTWEVPDLDGMGMSWQPIATQGFSCKLVVYVKFSLNACEQNRYNNQIN